MEDVEDVEEVDNVEYVDMLKYTLHSVPYISVTIFEDGKALSQHKKLKTDCSKLKRVKSTTVYLV